MEEGSRELKRASALLNDARAQLWDGEHDAACRSADEARSLSARHTKDLALASFLVDASERRRHSGDFESEGRLSSSKPDLRLQIRALAGEVTATPQHHTLPLRDCEREDFLLKSAESSREARELLARCDAVQAEVLASAERRSSEAAFAVAALQREPLLPFPSIPQGFALDAAPQLGAGDRLQMCADFLDTGVCAGGDHCPYAHRPGDLVARSQASLETLLRASGHL